MVVSVIIASGRPDRFVNKTIMPDHFDFYHYPLLDGSGAKDGPAVFVSTAPVGGTVECRIADTFTDSLARLTGEEQKAVKTTAFDLQLNRRQRSGRGL
jgi:hypothetical protein